MRRLLRSVRPHRGPERLYVGITDRCNYRCLMCALHSPLVSGLPPEGQRAQMSLDVFGRLIEDLKQLGGTEQIDLVGIGEPLLHPDFLEMAALVRGAGFRLNLVTNGFLLNEEKVRRLAELGLGKLQVSINSGSEEVYREVNPSAPPGTRQRILACLREMNSFCDRQGVRRPHLTLSSVIFRQTYRDLPGLVESAAEVGASYVALIPMGTTPDTESLALDEAEWSEARGIIEQADQTARRLGMTTNGPGILKLQQPDICRDIYSRIPCYLGNTFSLIYADGQVRFCCGCDRTLGNLGDCSFREIWRGEAYAQMRRPALRLPRAREAPARCGCFQTCPQWMENVAIHRQLYPGWVL